MNKTPPLILLLSLVAVAGAFLVWSGHDPKEDQPNVPGAMNEPATEAAATLVVGTDPTAETERDGVSEPLPEGLSRSVVLAPESRRLLVVQVWDGKPGVPAAQAAVFVLDGFAGPELGDPFAQHWSDLAESRGLRFTTDLHGRVELPAVDQWAIVTAQRVGSYGFAKVGREHRDVETITLQPDETVTVRVKDDADRAVAGVPVGVIQRVPRRGESKQWIAQLKEIEGGLAKVEAYIRDNPTQREAATAKMQELRVRRGQLTAAISEATGGDRRPGGKKTEGRGATREDQQPRVANQPELRAQRRTDADGLAVFRHFQVYRRAHEEWWPTSDIDQFEAVLLMPLQRAESRAFAGRPVPRDTLELRMPPTGSIALRTVDRDGRPFTHPVHAELHMRDEAAAWTRVQVRKEQNDAAIVFPFVGLGLQFTAQCRLDDEDFRWQAALFAGPSNPGERVTIDLVVAPGEGMLFGRLLDGANKPLAGARPTFLINSHAGRLEGEEITLDPEGRFHLPYQVRPQHLAPFRFEIRRDDLRPTAGLAMTLSTLPTDMVTDLGELRIDALSRLAHGTVVDDRGQPVAGAVVQLQREREVGDDKPRREFVDEAFSVARADAEGHYELFGELESGRYRLRAQAKDHFPLDTEDLRRSEPTNLRLVRKARVVGTVLTPSWMPSHGVRVRLESAVDPQQRRDDQVRDHEGKKYIYFDWVQPGIYHVVLSVQDFPDPFLRVDHLEILPGQQGPHPRLLDLDLAAYIQRFEVAAVDENGQGLQPDRPLLARIVRPDGSTGFVGFPWQQGRVEMFGVGMQVEVWPMTSGYRAETAVLVPGRSEVRFLRVPPVELHMPGLRQLVGTTPVWVTMQLAGGTGLPDRLETWDQRSGRIAGWYGKVRTAVAQLGANDAAQVTLMGDGRYQVVAYVGTKAAGGRQERVDLSPVDVRLVPGNGPLRVTSNFDPARMQQVAARLAQGAAANGAQNTK